MRHVVILVLMAVVASCSSVGISGTAKPTDNVGVTLGTILTPGGVRNTGTVNVRLF